MGLPVLKVLTGADALEARLLATMFETAAKAVPMSPIVNRAIQISSQGNSFKIAHVTVLAAAGIVIGGSKFIYSKMKTASTKSEIQRNDPPPNQNDQGVFDQQIQQAHQEVVVPLIQLIELFHEKFQKEQVLLEQADKSIDQKLEEQEKLQTFLNNLTEEDINIAAQNLQKRLNDVINKHQENLPIFNAALGELEEAEQDLAQAEEVLVKVQEEHKKIVNEITALKTLLLRSKIGHTERLQVFLEKVDALLEKWV